MLVLPQCWITLSRVAVRQKIHIARDAGSIYNYNGIDLLKPILLSY